MGFRLENDFKKSLIKLAFKKTCYSLMYCIYLGMTNFDVQILVFIITVFLTVLFLLN